MTHAMSAAFIAAMIVGTVLMRLATAWPSRSPLVEVLLAAMLCSGLLLLGASLPRLG